MNERDIYELIGESFEDKIKLDFNDVKKRIEKLDDKKITSIPSAAPSRRNAGRIFVIIGTAAAASLICVFGLTVFLSQFAGTKSDSSYALYASESACEDNEVFYAPTESETYEYHYEDNTDCAISDITGMDELQEETVSESDISKSDITTDSDMN